MRATCLRLVESHGWPDLTLDGVSSAMSKRNWQDFTRDAPIEDVSGAAFSLEAGEPAGDSGRDSDHDSSLAATMASAGRGDVA